MVVELFHVEQGPHGGRDFFQLVATALLHRIAQEGAKQARVGVLYQLQLKVSKHSYSDRDIEDTC